MLRLMACIGLAWSVVLSYTGEELQNGRKSGAHQEVEKERIDALVKAWADVRFWVYSQGVRTGWQRYQLRWGEYADEKMLVVDFDRATSLHHGDRFTAWLRPNHFLTPRAVRWADTGFDFRIEKGKIADLGKPAPENLTLLPELLAALQLPKVGAEIEFSLLDTGAQDAGKGMLKGLGQEKDPGAPQGSTPVNKSKATSKLSRSVEYTMWIAADSALARLRSNIKNPGGPPQLEELVPMDAREWTQEDLVLNEIKAAAQLMQLSSLVGTFQTNDFDGNRSFDFWTGDVSGLYRLIPPKRESPIALISKELASADASPLPAGSEKGGATMAEALGSKPVALFGYLFKALTKGRARNESIPLNDGSNRNRDMFGFCAYPAEYGKSGRRTFFLTEDCTPYWKDVKGQPISEVPADPLREGWQWAGVRK